MPPARTVLVSERLLVTPVRTLPKDTELAARVAVARS